MGLGALAMGCRFSPKYADYARCGGGTSCPTGYVCLASEGVCLPVCGEASGACGDASDGGDGGSAGTPDAGPLAFKTNSLAPGDVGRAYSVQIETSGGVAPVRMAIASGGLLPGLSLSSSGLLSGTPASAGSVDLTLQASDSSTPPQGAAMGFLLTVNPATGTALSVVTSSLPSGKVAQSYSAPLAAANGTAPYAWSLTSGSLPAGLTLSASGSIDGVPTTAGTASISVTVMDSSSPPQTASKSLSIAIAPTSGTTLSIATAGLPAGTTGIGYSASLAATGGQPPYAWSLAAGSSLPSGLALGSSGAISGTPTVAGTTTFTVQVTDSSSSAQVATRQLSLSISAGSGSTPLSISTTSLPGGTVGAAYGATIAATGGLSPYSFSLAPGSVLPAGLALSAAGLLSGTLSTAGTYSFTIDVKDSSSPQQQSANATYLLAIAGGASPLSVTTTTLPDGMVGSSYSQFLAASGGTSPYAWTLVGGALPLGLSLSGTGEIFGAPTAAGSSSFTVQVTDSAATSQVATKGFSITVAAPGALLRINTSNLPDAHLNLSYSAQLTAAGGTLPYSWSVVAGALPTGLSLASSGALTGMPKAAGTFDFTVEVSDNSQPPQKVSRALSIRVR